MFRHTGLHVFELVLLVIFTLFFTKPAAAAVGVGIGIGKIDVNEALHPGTIYNLPSLPVLNTGTDISKYRISISYFDGQKENKPPVGWFIFQPNDFVLTPNSSKIVNIKLNLPLQVPPGQYFAFIEARPLQNTPTGQTTVNIAAAAKLSFTVVPASYLSGLYYKAASFFKVYEPWPQRVLIVVLVLIIIIILRRFIKIDINIKPKS